MTGKSQHKTTVLVRWTARIIALLFSIIFFFWNTVFAVGSVMADLHGAITGYIALPIALGILVLAAEIVSWRRERIGGILFIMLSAAYFLIHLINDFSGLKFISIPYMIRGLFTDWAIFGLPMLIAGILFLLAARRSKNTDLELAPESGTPTDTQNNKET